MKRVPRPNEHNWGWTRYAARYPERAAAYKSPAWTRRRRAWLAEHPRCVWCGRPATDCDHVVAISLGGSFDGPVQSLCRRCHLRKTAEDSKTAKKRLKFEPTIRKEPR